MNGSRYRSDGWPVCPRCGQDTLVQMDSLLLGKPDFKKPFSCLDCQPKSMRFPASWMIPEKPVEPKPVDPNGSRRWRALLANRCNSNPALQKAMMRTCADSVPYWVNNFVWTCDQRSEMDSRDIPFDLFAIQMEFLNWIKELHMKAERIKRSGKDFSITGLCEKSRGQGATWLAVAYGVHGWTFSKGFVAGYGSLKREEVDEIGNMNTILEKARFIVRLLPSWMIPKSYNELKDATHCKILNRQNGAAIIGEGGDNMGRGGKAQPLDSKILTPHGFVPMGSVVPGMEIIGSNGKPTRIISVHPQGEKQIYKVSFSDGASAECCGEHLWRVTDKMCRKVIARKGNRTYGSRFKVMTTEQIRKSLTVKRRDSQIEFQYRIPVVNQVQFSRKRLPLDPYLIGALLGDGSIKHIGHNSVGFTTSEDEMVELIRSVLPDSCEVVNSGIEFNYRLCRPNGQKIKNPIKEGLRSLGLSGKGSHDKFIPEIYKTASVKDRLSLVQGLMDTDGCADKRQSGCKSIFASASKRLADDLIDVVRSLGGIATYSFKKVSKAARQGKWARIKSKLDSHWVILSMPENLCPFRLARKAAKWKPHAKYKPSRSIVAIESAGEKECQCISVEAADGLYVTDDFVVTHNTSIFFVDESAHLLNSKAVDKALAETSNCKIHISTPKGAAGGFYEKIQSGNFPTFRMHWRDDPRKDEAWAEAKKKELNDPTAWAEEYEIDYHASIEGVCIPNLWVQAAVDLSLPEFEGPKVAGLDCSGEGANQTVLIPRRGPTAEIPIAWSGLDTTQSAHKAAAEAEKANVAEIYYDVSGLGIGYKSAWKATDEPMTIKTHPINSGLPATDRKWPNGKISKELFVNQKAEFWWMLRARFEKAYEYKEGLAEHPADEMISIPNHPQLISELSKPLYFHRETGKIVMESKKEMRSRGVKSPDFADALVLAFAPRPKLKKAVWW